MTSRSGEAPLRDLPDQALMLRIRSGDRGAYAALLERYWTALVRYATGIVGTPDEASDVVQDAFVRLWRFRTDWVPEGHVSAYLYRITGNLALNARRARVADLKRSGRATEGPLSTRPATPDQDLDERTLEQAVHAAVAELSERRREVFLLSRFQGLSYREIGETLGISVQTVANQMSAALAQLRHSLSEYLGET